MSLKCSDCVFTSFQNFLDFDVIRTEATVELEVIGVVQKWSTQWEEEFLNETQMRCEKTKPIEQANKNFCSLKYGNYAFKILKHLKRRNMLTA